MSRAGWSGGLWEEVDEGAGHPLAVADGDRYELGGLLGEGGMGRVFAAHDRRLHRQVALKVAVDRPGVRDRLAQEAWITAQLEHPGIVPVYDAGETPDGRLFYTMRVVRGRTLADALGSAPDQQGRLTWVRSLLTACQAVAYAHGRGIVHRDLKPANVLVGELGETQVVDWGLARPVSSTEEDAGDWFPAGHALHTQGRAVGTPAYMAPEQLEGAPCDPRADVWSLGATLFELVTGAPPFGDDDTHAVLARLASSEPVPRAEGPPELAAIVERALQRDPAARYPTARELAEDLARWVDGRRVHAYEYSSWELVVRLVRRWQAPLSVLAVSAVLLAAVGTAASIRTREARARADRHLASALVAQARSALAAAEIPEAEALAAWALTLQEVPEARGILAAAAAAPAPLRVEATPLPCRGRVQGPGQPVLCAGDGVLSLWELGAAAPRWTARVTVQDAVHLPVAGRVVVLEPTPRLVVLDERDGAVVSTSEHPAAGRLHADGRWVLDANAGVLLLLDAVTGERVSHAVCDGGRVAAADLVPGSYTVACLDGSVWRGTPPHAPERAGEMVLGTRYDPAAQIAVSADGELLLGASGPGDIVVVDARTGGLRWHARSVAGRPRRLAWSDDGQQVLVIGEASGPELRDARTGAVLARLPRGAADGGFTADGVWARGERLLRYELPELWASAFEAPSGLTTATASPDGRHVVGTHGSGGLRVWSVDDGAVVSEPRWHDYVTKWGAFSPDGSRYLAAGIGETGVRVFDTATWRSVHLAHEGRTYRRVGWLADGSWWGASYHSGVTVWPSGAAAPAVLPGGTILDGASAPDHHAAVLLSQDGAVARLEPGGTLVSLLEVPGAVAVDLGVDDTVVIATREEVRILDRTLAERLRIPMTAALSDVRLSPDGRRLATGHLDGTARVWALSEGGLRAVLRGHAERVVHVAFEPDPARLITASWDGTARRWDLAPLQAAPEDLLAGARRRWGLEPEAALTP